ncbi:hypothetical protein HK105_205300 [Polyrhizophydium stewartii]|uniref:Uncharacterized protein n=1 Tax=Polyrhizophydium stewartii TaxID=2732419 RepID=A0ABR4N6U7_9FUNG
MAILSKPQSALITLSSWGTAAQQRIVPLAVATKDAAVTSVLYSKAVLDRYPPLKAFVLALAAFSAVPVAVFVGFGTATGAVVLGVAGTGAAMAQGTMLAVASFVLFWFLLGALFFAGLTAFWFSAGYFGLKVVRKLQQ